MLPSQTIHSQQCHQASRSRTSTLLPAVEADLAAAAAPAAEAAVDPVAEVAAPAVEQEAAEEEEVLLTMKDHLYPLLISLLRQRHLPTTAAADPLTTLLTEVVAAEVAVEAAVTMTKATIQTHHLSRGQTRAQTTAPPVVGEAAAIAVPRVG